MRDKTLAEGVGIHELCLEMHQGGKLGSCFFGIARVTMKAGLSKSAGLRAVLLWARHGDFLRLRCSNTVDTMYEDSKNKQTKQNRQTNKIPAAVASHNLERQAQLFKQDPSY